jgi:multiple sugar transport system substrate-binding protein
VKVIFRGRLQENRQKNAKKLKICAFASAITATVGLIFSSAFLTTSCEKSLLDPDDPVTINVWHNYGGQMKNLMDELISEFNTTVGVDEGIIISVTAISGSSELHEMLVAAADQVPGALPLPDITTAYPKTAAILLEQDLLTNLSTYYDQKVVDEYVPQFIEEGRLNTDGLYVFPIAKSTELLFVNRTLFDRFAADSGFDYSDLATYEGISAASLAYYDWTDQQTPEIPRDGKAFFMPDSLFNQALVGSRQLGSALLKNAPAAASLDLEQEVYCRIFKNYYLPAVSHGIALFDGYSADLFKTGELVCSVGSTAGVLYYPDKITYADNTQEEANYAFLPCPTFAGGERVALQRGGGMCVTSSDEAKKMASAIFIKWFTEPEQNLRFTLSSGYLPVQKAAFDQLFELDLTTLNNKNIAEQLKTVLDMYQEYEFFYTPYAPNVDELQKRYEQILQDQVANGRELLAEYIQKNNGNGQSLTDYLNEITTDALAKIREERSLTDG